MAGGKLKAYELRSKSKQELMNKLKELKTELGTLRVAKVTGGAPNKLAKIHNQRAALREAVKGQKYLPLDLREKKTRALRRALSTEQKTMKTTKQQRKAAAFPMRKFALKA